MFYFSLCRPVRQYLQTVQIRRQQSLNFQATHEAKAKVTPSLTQTVLMLPLFCTYMYTYYDNLNANLQMCIDIVHHTLCGHVGQSASNAVVDLENGLVEGMRTLRLHSKRTNCRSAVQLRSFICCSIVCYLCCPVFVAICITSRFVGLAVHYPQLCNT